MNSPKLIPPTDVQRFLAEVNTALEMATLDIIRDLDVWSCCLHCKHFNEPTEVCALGGVRPPARVITFGCPAFDDGHPKEEPPPPAPVPAPGPKLSGRFMNDLDDDIPF